MALKYKVGDKVIHRAYGERTIVRIGGKDHIPYKLDNGNWCSETSLKSAAPPIPLSDLASYETATHNHIQYTRFPAGFLAKYNDTLLFIPDKKGLDL